MASSNIWESFNFNDLLNQSSSNFLEELTKEVSESKQTESKQTEYNGPLFTVRDLMHKLLQMDLDAPIEVDDKKVIGAAQLKLTKNVVKLQTRPKYSKVVGGISEENPLQDFNTLNNDLHQRIRQSLIMNDVANGGNAKYDSNLTGRDDWSDLLE